MNRRDFFRLAVAAPVAIAAAKLAPAAEAPTPPKVSIDEFRRRWNAMMAGARNRWWLPVLTADGEVPAPTHFRGILPYITETD